MTKALQDTISFRSASTGRQKKKKSSTQQNPAMIAPPLLPGAAKSMLSCL
jgi:hypothetical protein